MFADKGGMFCLYAAGRDPVDLIESVSEPTFDPISALYLIKLLFADRPAEVLLIQLAVHNLRDVRLDLGRAAIVSEHRKRGALRLQADDVAQFDDAALAGEVKIGTTASFDGTEMISAVAPCTDLASKTAPTRLPARTRLIEAVCAS